MPIPAVISDLSPIIGTGPSPNGGQPGGGENPSTFDDYLRAYGAFIAQLRAGSGFANSGAFRIPFFDASGAWASSADFVRDASGNVGVGGAPLARLSVQSGLDTAAVFLRGANPGAAVAAAHLATPVATGFSGAPVYGFWFQGSGMANPAIETLSLVTNSLERVRIDSVGNVGIGTASPATALHVQRTGNTELRLSSQTSGDCVLQMNAEGVNAGSITYSRANQALQFINNGAERMRIDATGHQINLPGSTTPPTLTVNGQLNITPTSNTNVRISFRGTDGVTRVANITLA
jgi:hypothetical protein